MNVMLKTLPLNRFRIHLLCFIFLCCTGKDLYAVQASDGGKPWRNEKTKTVRPAKNPDVRNSYGGFAGEKVDSSGFFKLIEKGRKWWLVDPEGCLFFSVGMNSVEPERVNASKASEWTEQTHKLLTEAGFNTIGRWSAPELFHRHKQKIPWCSTQGFMKEYVKVRPKNRGKGGYPKETIPVFDPEWPEFCQKFAEKKMRGTVDDPYLLGHFSDNELPFRPDALLKYLSLPEEDYGHQAALAWLKENRISKGKADQAKVQAEFLEAVSKLYFETVSKAIKAVDPNHLYIGSRLHGKTISEPVIKGAAVCDVISINCYHHWVGDREQTKDWYKWSKRPFLVGEFYAMKVKSKRTNADGAGFRVLSHKDAGEFYHTYTHSLLKEHPNCVGWHWFKYADTNDDYQKGIVSQYGKPHEELLEAMEVLNSQVYALRGLR